VRAARQRQVFPALVPTQHAEQSLISFKFDFKAVLRIRIRTGSRFNRSVDLDLDWIRNPDPEGQKQPTIHKHKKNLKFHVLKSWMFFFDFEGCNIITRGIGRGGP
jgi:hypothetical protein